MTHAALLAECLEDAPKFNKRVCEGIAVHDIGRAMQEIDEITRSAAENFPEQVQYLGIRRMSPEEHHRETFGQAKDRKKRTFGLWPTDIYPTEMRFAYIHSNGQPPAIIRRMMYLPFVGQGGTMRVNGSVRTIHPVLADKVFTATSRDLFVILARARFTLERNDYVIVEDGRRISSYYVFGKIHQKQATSGGDRTIPRKAVTTIGHYLICKEGVVGAFKRYHGLDVEVIDIADSSRYTSDDYVVYSSQYYGTGQRPADEAFRAFGYTPSNVALVFRRDQIKDDAYRVLVASVFFAIDLFPEQLNLRDINHPDPWRLVLALIIWRKAETEGRALSKVDKHIGSLDSYIDNVSRLALEAEGIVVDDIYELFSYLNTHISRIQAAADPGSMWGKYLLVNRYALSGIIESIFRLTWMLNTEASKGTLSYDMTSRIISQRLLSKAVTSHLGEHGEFDSVQFPGDCYMLKHTCQAIRQTSAKNPRGGSKGRSQISVNDPSYQLHVSIAEAGSATNYNKASIDGRTRINPNVMTDDDNRIVRNPDFIELLDNAHEEIYS